MRALLFILMISSSLFAAENHQAFFKEYCISCHGPDKQKGDIRLDTLTWSDDDEKSLDIWRNVIDQIDMEEMPPAKKKQPSKEESTAIIGDIEERFTHLKSKAQVVLRRLNKQEYTNTIRDLMHVNAQQLNPAKGFPSDDLYHGFNNVSDVQKMSDFILKEALKASTRIVEAAAFPEEKPKVTTIKLGERPIKKGKNSDNYFYSKGKNPENNVVILHANDENKPGDTRGMHLISSVYGPPEKGFYDFEFKVESLGQGTVAKFSGNTGGGGDPLHPKYQPDDLHRLEFYYVVPNPDRSPSDTRKMNRILFDAIDLENNKVTTIKKRVWLEKGWRVSLGFGNGAMMGNPKNYYTKLTGKEIPMSDKKKDRKAYNAALAKGIRDIVENRNMPRIKVYEASRTGPFYEEWPPKSHAQLYNANVEKTLLDFATRAFRRPVEKSEIQHLIDLAKNDSQGLKFALKAILCSPKFLYMVEESEGELNSYEIASRLSYMFWSTMPDDRLFDLAAKNKLVDEKIVRQEAIRLLEDPKSDEFIHNFIWSWLKLKSTIDMAPDVVKFASYNRDRISEAMVKETKLFFKEILDKNLPVSTFIASDFSYINSDLARRYGIKGVNTSAAFQRVPVKPLSGRSGLLGQTSVLTASANGVDTSPVVRGMWILENLLGIHPPPAPDDVEIPEIDLRGDFTLKELYAKHRTVETCNSCHSKIDPLGFALENFNATGLWRNEYENGSKVDPTGQMPDGTPFKDYKDLKQNILDDMTHFNRNLTSKLLTYASGRKMKSTDRVVIDELANRITEEKLGFKDLVLEVVCSDIFMRK